MWERPEAGILWRDGRGWFSSIHRRKRRLRSFSEKTDPVTSADQGRDARAVLFDLYPFLARADSFIRHSKNLERRKVPC